MKFSEVLYANAKDLWEKAAQKPFVLEMAEGTLNPERFRYYMLQDYLYLLDYIEILKSILNCSEKTSQREFLKKIISETENETYRVHVPNMRKIGVCDEEIRNAVKAQVIVDYVGYMRSQLEELGLIAGLTALLQCSWVYAYIGQKVTEKYSGQIAASPYRSWFDAYACPEYIDANQMWIDVLDRETEGISQDEGQRLTRIFRKCAEYENRFWDVLHGDA